MRVLLGLVVAVACGCAARAAPVCGAGVTDDTLRPLPVALAPAVRAAFGLTMPAAQVVRGTVVRCVDGQVWACNLGADLPCGKANESRGLPRAGRQWCTANPDADYVPAYITGQDTVWRWRCVHGVARAGGPAAATDARGFLSRYWRRIG